MADIKKYAVIVAGGSGTRMGTIIAKQFLLLHGKPVLYYSITAFIDAFPDIQVILVLPQDQLDNVAFILDLFPAAKNITVVEGGTTRFHSVQNGLKKVEEKAIVFVHDGVRPLVSKELIHSCYEHAMSMGSAIPAIPVTDSIRIVRQQDSGPLAREELRIIQTPQTFLSDVILPAFEQPYNPSFTDEATVAEAFGKKIYLVSGERSNLKVTTPEDMTIAEALLKARQENEQ